MKKDTTPGRDMREMSGYKTLHLKKILLGAASILGLCALGFTPVAMSAEEASKEVQRDEVEDFSLDEIVVTATKRATNLQDTSLSITAVGASSMEKMSAIDFIDYVGAIPGISYTSIGATGDQYGNRNISLRGLAATTGAATVGFYIDEAPMAFTEPKIFDVNRVEILRGPQGTLYGASSMGGTIRVITNAPDHSDFEGKVDLTYSNTRFGGNNYNINVMLNVPVIEDKLAVRVVGVAGHEEGYVDNIFIPRAKENYNDEDDIGGRISILFEPSETVKIRPSIFYQKVKLENDGRFEVGRPNFQIESLLPTPSSEELILYSLDVDVELDFADLTSNSSYLEHDRNGELDMTGIPAGAFGAPGAPIENMHDRFGSTRFTQEIRLTSKGDGDLQWLIGGFYSDWQGTYVQDFSPDGISDYLGGLPYGDDLFYMTDEPYRKQLAFFADVTYDITDRLSIEAGTRWFHYKIGKNRIAGGLLNGGPEDISRETTDSGFTSLLKASYAATEDLLVYTSVSQGYRPGFTVGVPPSTCDGQYIPDGDENSQNIRPDKLLAYEIGEKATLLGGRMTVNSSVYYNEWTDIQQSVDLPCGFPHSDNGGKAHSIGFEVEMSVQPIDGLNLMAAVSYVDAKLDDAVETLGALEGDTLVSTNDWQVYLDATYSFPVSDSMEAYVHADFTYMGELAFAYGGGTSPLDRRDGYSQLGLRVGVMVENDLEIAIFATNVTDQVVNLGSWSFFSPLTQYTIRPRTIGLNIKKNF